MYNVICYIVRLDVRYRIFTCDAAYDLSETCDSDIVCKNAVLAILTYNIVRHIVYDIIREMYDVVYELAEMYGIARQETGLAISRRTSYKRS
jgi:hypothetical protein